MLIDLAKELHPEHLRALDVPEATPPLDASTSATVS